MHMIFMYATASVRIESGVLRKTRIGRAAKKAIVPITRGTTIIINAALTIQFFTLALFPSPKK